GGVPCGGAGGGGGRGGGGGGGGWGGAGWRGGVPFFEPPLVLGLAPFLVVSLELVDSFAFSLDESFDFASEPEPLLPAPSLAGSFSLEPPLRPPERLSVR